MSLARRNLLREKTRFALSVTGVALAEMLVLLLGGFLSGIDRQISAYLDQAPGSVVVAQAGVRDLLLGTSLLPPETGEAVDTTEGVESAASVIVTSCTARIPVTTITVLTRKIPKGARSKTSA